MARMLLLEQGEHDTTYATITEEGSLVIENRYLNDNGSLDFAHSVVVLAGGVQKLLELLSIMQPNNGLQSDGAVRAPEGGIYKVEWLDAETVRLSPRS